MLQKIVLHCVSTKEEKPSYHWGSLLHGALVELLPEDMAQELHDIKLRPFSQYVNPLDENRLDWHIGLWDDKVSEQIIKAVMPLTEIYIKSKNIRLSIIGTERKALTERDYVGHFFNTDEPCRRYLLEFITPCTHKSNGRYVLFPTSELIVQSLSARFSAYSREYDLDDPEVLAQIATNISISKYALRSAQYSLDGSRILGYRGNLSLFIHGPAQLARLAGVILSFCEYAGIGIKTALGMGGCRINQITKQQA